MKRECAVVQDLLVLYEDDVLKEQSRRMIEEHLRGCEDCMQVYENSVKELPAMGTVPESSEKEQEAAAVRVMGKLKKRAAYKTVLPLAAAVAAVLILTVTVGDICNRITETYWGIAGMFCIVPTEDIEVESLYRLKNGELYCTLKSEKGVCGSMLADWNLPAEKQLENTDEAEKELRFRTKAFWEWDAAEEKQQSYIFSTQREGAHAETGAPVIQSCGEINVYGRTKKDKLTIWKAGQNVEEAPEEIEKQAVRMYIREGQTAKAVRLCELLGWDDYEKLFREENGEDDMRYTYTGERRDTVEFTREGDSIYFLKD